MPMNRIKKLLADEYLTFKEIILVESPFAEINNTGRGLKQVYLGLTASNLIIASDKLVPATVFNIYSSKNDPETETLEILSIFPLNFINISISDRKQRKVIKTCFPNNLLRYFELGGFEKRKLLWILWCERIYYLNPNHDVLTISERSSGTSNDKRIVYQTKMIKKGNGGKYEMWNYFFEIHREYQIEKRTWKDRYLYLGMEIENENNNNRPKPIPGLGETPSMKSLYFTRTKNIVVSTKDMFSKMSGKSKNKHRKKSAMRKIDTTCIV